MTAAAHASEHESAPLVRALLWKEWREQRPVVTAGIALTVVIPLLGLAFAAANGSAAYLRYQAEIIALSMVAFVLPVFAALCAATASGERLAGEAPDFLLSRPVSRAWLWAVKLGTALAGLAVIFVSSMLVGEIIWWLTAVPWRGGRGFSVWIPLPYDAPVANFSLQSLVFGGTAVAFCAAFFLALITRRALAAAIGGLLLAIPIAAVGYVVATALVADQRLPYGIDSFLNRYFASAAAGTLVASFFLFRAGSSASEQPRRARVALAVGLAAIFTLLGAMGAAVRATTPREISREVFFVDTAPTRSLALVRGVQDGVAGSSFWIVGPRWPLRRITPGKTGTAAIVPGDQWVVYDTSHGPLGLRRAACGLRMVRLDGSDDRLVHEPVPCDVPRVFSPDGAHVALFIGNGGVLLLTLDRSASPRRLDVSDPVAMTSSPRWWVRGGIVLEGRDSVHLLDVGTGEVRALFDDDAHYRVRIYESFDRTLAKAQAGGRFVVHRLPRRADEPPPQTFLVNGGEGAQSLPYCPGRERTAAFARDGGQFFWVECGDGDETLSTLWMRDLDGSGGRVDTALATIHGRIDKLSPAPSGSRVLVTTHVPNWMWRERRPGYRPSELRWRQRQLITRMEQRRVLMIERDGRVQDVSYALGHRWPTSFNDIGEPFPDPRDRNDPRWSPVGWFDDSTLLLERVRFVGRGRDRERHHQFAALDVTKRAKPTMVLDAEVDR